MEDDDYYSSHPLRFPRVPIALIGFFGSGHDEVGRTVASLTSLPFTDIRDRIAHDAGMGPGEIARKSGSGALAGAEACAIERALSSAPPGIVVLTPNSLAEGPLRRAVLERSALVYIHAPPEDLIASIIEKLTERRGAFLPWISADAFCPSDVEALLAARSRAYEDAALRIETARRAARSIAREIIDHFDLWGERYRGE